MRKFIYSLITIFAFGLCYGTTQAGPITFTIQEIGSSVTLTQPFKLLPASTLPPWTVYGDLSGSPTFRAKDSVGMAPIVLNDNTDLDWFGNYGKQFTGSISVDKKYKICDNLGNCGISVFNGALTTDLSGFLILTGSFSTATVGGNQVSLKLITNSPATNQDTKDLGAGIQSVTPVPEPATFALVAAGVGIIGWRKRKNLAKKSA